MITSVVQSDRPTPNHLRAVTSIVNTLFLTPPPTCAAICQEAWPVCGPKIGPDPTKRTHGLIQPISVSAIIFGKSQESELFAFMLIFGRIVITHIEQAHHRTLKDTAIPEIESISEIAVSLRVR